jgi:predicted RNase H-like HicB family nuclease
MIEFTIELERGADGRWTASIQQIPDLRASGKTQRKAIERVKHEALEYLARKLRVAADNVYRVEED